MWRNIWRLLDWTVIANALVGFKSRYWLHCHFSFFNFWFPGTQIQIQRGPISEKLILQLSEDTDTGYELQQTFEKNAIESTCSSTLHFVFTQESFWTFVEKLINNIKSMSFPIGLFRFWDFSSRNQKLKKQIYMAM